MARRKATTVYHGARRAAAFLGLLTAFVALSATPASAAPSFSLSLTSDVSDVQAVYVEASAGQFRLSFGPGGPGVSETADIPATASAAEVQAALNALSNINEGGGSVSVQIGGGDSNGVNPYLVTFDGGPLKNTLQPLMTAKSGTEPLNANPLGGGPAIAYVATRAPGGVARSDERINYSIEVENTAAPVVGNPTAGTALGCNGARPNKAWTPAPAANRPSTFEFEWRRNGAVIPGEEGPAYVATGADEGTVIQCLVKGTSANGNSAAKYASLPGAVVDPQPVTSPPAANAPTAATSRPTITGTTTRTCWAPGGSTAATAGTGFSGAPTWTFQWLRNGEPIVGANTNSTATTSQYAIGAEDEGTRLQCEAIATNAGGSLVSVSEGVSIGSVTQPAALSAANTPTIIQDGSSPVIELDLPAGTQSHLVGVATSTVATSNYWSCSELPPAGVDPGRVVCTNPNLLAPQTNLTTGGTNSLGNLTLGVSLGGDVPDLASLEARVSGGGAATVVHQDTFSIGPKRPFGLIPGRFSARALSAAGDDYIQAGGHPAIATTSFSLNRDRKLLYSVLYNARRPVENLRNVLTDIPAGFIGNPQAPSELCERTDLILTEPSSCPPASLVGELALQSPAIGQPAFGLNFKRMPLYAITPERGVPAQFATAETFNKAVYVLTPRLRPDGNYAISIDSIGAVESFPILDVRATLCGYGANPKQSGPVTLFGSCKQKGDAGAYEKPFLTTQTECAVSNPVTTVNLDSWADPGDYKTAQAVAPKMTGCELVPFEPKLDLQPTTGQAESASGLDVDLTVPTDGFEDPDGLTQAHLKKTTVTMPQGMSLNPSAADGLAACTQAQLGMANGVPNNDPVQCPDASKIGTALVKTPILEETLEGGIYLAKQGDHPFPGDIAAIYVVAESKERGVLIKLPGRVEIRPGGQIVSTFDDNPQAPFSSLELSFDSGPRAALMTPQRCGTYNIVSELTPWSAADPDNPTPAETVSQTSSFDVTSGPGGGPCPNGALLPTMRAGLTSPLAGASSPFVFNLSRPDGTQRINGLALTLPQGLAANLRGVAYCPDATLASIPSAQGTGAAEIANPSCPAASRLGSVSVAAGTGNPFWVNSGSAYLAGPYKGAPLSLAVVIPAVAGPFDLGNVVVRNAILVNPKTAQVSIKSDPLPTHVHNLPVDLRAVRVAVDRPGFMRAPTNCEEMRIDAVIDGEEGGSVPISNRFQVGECGSLGFKPHVKLQLKGGTKRNKFQRLTATVTAREGDANIAGASVRFPRSIFLEQNHIRTVCTRVQFAANSCPQASIYGFAEAETPLLDQPLRGPVYLRSSDNPLPDLVAALRGPDYQPITIELAGRTDSKNKGIRNTFDVVPDAPVSKFTLRMKGGKRSLLVTSTDICKRKQRADVRMRGQNGMQRNFRPVIKVNCKKKKQKQKKTRRGKASR